jgi:uncharacterized membrane protein
MFGQLGTNSSISLITVAPGTELYARFGHSMILVQDPDNAIDKAYSYGTFDFNTENFYWKFLKGTLPYTISANRLDDVLYFYSNIEHRTMVAQKLDLNLQQRNEIYQRLETNLLPQNKEYQYKFFYDNCSSRIRDVFEKQSGIKIKWRNLDSLQGLSYRQWMNKYLPYNTWTTFGMNLALGYRSDVKANASQSTYLPDNLFYALNFAKNGELPLVKEIIPLYEEKPFSDGRIHLTGPIFILSILSIFALFVSIKKPTFQFNFDKVLFTIYGLFAYLIFFLATGTDHEVMSWNASCLMLLPTHFPLVFWFSNSRKRDKWVAYLKYSFLISAVGLILASFYFGGLFFVGLPVLIRLYSLWVQKK